MRRRLNGSDGLSLIADMYSAPANRLLRWIAEIGPELPDPVQRRLRSTFFTSFFPLVVGAANTIAVAEVAYLRSGNPIFAFIALIDLTLLSLRIPLLMRVEAPSGPIFATGMLWACLQGATVALVVLSGDVAMSIVTLASGLAAIGLIIGRNFAARRYAMAQILVIDLSYKTAFLSTQPEFAPLIFIQTLAFIAMNWSIMSQHRSQAVSAIIGEMESRKKSVTDPLTGLLNRRGFEEIFNAPQLNMRDRTLFYLDLDGFKQVNDRLGHAAGDILLCEVGRRLREMVGPDDIICRLGGDEFLLLARRLNDDDARLLAGRIIAGVTTPYHIEKGVQANIGVSIGISKERYDVLLGLSEMMLQADRALYAAKTSGKGRCILHRAMGDDTSFGFV